MDPQKITELANLLRNNGDKILNSEFNFTLSGSLLRALNDSFTLIADATEFGAPQTFQVVKPINTKSSVFRDLQLVHDFVQKTAFLCIIQYPGDDYFEGQIDITKFRSLKRLEVQKTNVKQITGIQPLRSQIQQLICVKSIKSVEDIITHCGGDNSNGFVWNELKIADFSYNQLHTVDSSLEFAQYLQHLNLRHNQLVSVEAIKWLPNLKTLDLSFNRLTCIPQFHMEACKRLQVLNIGNNLIEDLLGIAKLDALTDLDLSDNFLLNHSFLLPLSAILTLKYLNLYGNPLHCHPKHRLATAQFLHKNTSTVKFILDFEPLSKSEKAVTGTQQMRHATSSSIYRFSSQKTAISISGSTRSSAQQTPASSVGSQRSFRLPDNNTSKAASTVPTVIQDESMIDSCISNNKKRGNKIRTVEIENIETNYDEADTTKQSVSSDITSKNDSVPKFSRTDSITKQNKNSSLTTSLIAEQNLEYLETKKHIETMREKFGDKWLQSENAEMMHSVLGIESEPVTSGTMLANEQRHTSRQLFQDYLGEFSESSQNDTSKEPQNKTSTPTESFLQNANNTVECMITPIKSTTTSTENPNDSTTYISANNSDIVTSSKNQTLYKTADDSGLSDGIEGETEEEEIDRTPHLKDVYSSTIAEEPEISDVEDDEETYIVYTTKSKEALFLTISNNFLREKDTITQRTKSKWSLKILESCDRLKSNNLRINFDTVKKDKQERVYTIEDGLCQELEKKLREILSQRCLSEMNQTIYRCVNCKCQFSHENKYNHISTAIRCPDCKSTFICEIHDIPQSLNKGNIAEDLQPASPAAMALPMDEEQLFVSGKNKTVNDNDEIGEAVGGVEETNSIGSANSLNESSSCSKISNSQSSFDSNQSVVGSSNTDREADFKSQCESDVDIISNPSQSSIEVLDHMNNHFASRKTSEDRRVLQRPSLETIDDNHSLRLDYTLPSTSPAAASNIVKTQQQIHEEQETDIKEMQQQQQSNKHQQQQQKSSALAHFNLTESSSSGSVTDSVCTAYENQTDKNIVVPGVEEQREQHGQKIIIENVLNAETASISSSEKITERSSNNKKSVKKAETGMSSVLGVLFQSTNVLMSSSKKLIDGEVETKGSSTSNKSSPSKHLSRCTAYKFNYNDFNDVDHRFKLYFYQNKFEDGERFKWLVRGRIYNENTRTLCTGIVVMSTCKCYLMEAFADEQDDVTKWLRQIVSVTVNRLERIQLLPWKIGLSFYFRDWGSFLLLLQDILRTDSLLLHFANNQLPSQCELDYEVSKKIMQRLNGAVVDEKLKMLSILNGCEVQCENAKRTFTTCGLLTTDTRLCLTSGNFEWLCNDSSSSETDIELCLTQLMSNLMEVEKVEENVFTINFLDETQNKNELWKCIFETKENAESSFNTIGQSWEKLFGVPLLTTTES